MSLPEILLWQALKARPADYKFRKQFPFDLYVLDFTCLEARLCIEVDGEFHNRGDQPAFDIQRDAELVAKGFHTLRIPARIILRDLDAAVTAITTLCVERAPHKDYP